MTNEAERTPTTNSQAEFAKQHRNRKISPWSDESKNPCVKESEMSLKCMADNDYDRDKCSLHFLNYRNCQKFWDRVSRDRRRRRISPALPPVSEREAIWQQYNKTATEKMSSN